MDQADIADQVITEYLERAIAAARGIRVEKARYFSSTANCIDCGEKIPARRKAAIPDCMRCVSCEEDYELSNKGYVRVKIERESMDDIIDDVLLSPL
jgi:phage/conjugal plasmid C-4 type zinc finger TraR family protein